MGQLNFHFQSTFSIYFSCIYAKEISGINKLRKFDLKVKFLQAKPLFKDRKKFKLMADPLLERNYPVKGLYQALAVAAMCLQEEASTRPLIGDVVTALEYLAIKTEEGTSETDEQAE